MNIFNQLGQKFFSDKKEGKLLRYITILGLIGIFLLMMSSNIIKEDDNLKKINEGRKEGANMSVAYSSLSYSEKLEKDLEEILEVMKGVGQVKAKIILEKSSAYEFKYDTKKLKKLTTETDSDGGERKITEEDQEKNLVILKESDGSEKPLVKVENKPVIKGVLVVAEGACDPQIEYSITKAVSNFFSIPLYKVNVLPLQGR